MSHFLNFVGLFDGSDSCTIKDAYKILKKNSSPKEIEVIEMSYNLIKTGELRVRYSILENSPYESVLDIAEIERRPKRQTVSQWLSLLDNESEA